MSEYLTNRSASASVKPGPYSLIMNVGRPRHVGYARAV